MVTLPDSEVQNAREEVADLDATPSDKVFQQKLNVFVCLKMQNK